MQMSPSTRAELQARRHELALQIAALDALLGDEPVTTEVRPTKQPEAKTKRGRPTSSTGLTAMIRQYVAETPGITTDDLLEKIVAAGFKTRGKTPIRTRLTGELGRMRKNGEVKRRGERHYPAALPPAEGGETAAA